MALEPEHAEVNNLRAELAAVEAEYGLTVVSVFPGTNPDATPADVLRGLIPSVRRVGEELRQGTLEEVPLDD